MKTATDHSASWTGDIRLNGFVAAFRHGCSKLAEKEGDVCTLHLSLIGEDGIQDVAVYIVPKESAARQSIEEVLNRVTTDETFVRGYSLRTCR